MTRLVNPVVRRVLRSPLHDLLSDAVALVVYDGRRSGLRRATPASYLLDGDELLLASRERRLWWRNLRGGAPVAVVLKGRDHTGWAEVEPRSPERAAEILTRLYVRSGHELAASRAADLARDRVVVRIKVDAPVPLPPPLRGRALRRRWTAAVTIGETIGFAVPAVAGAALAARGASFAVTAVVVLLAGAVEGAVLGLAQAVALRAALASIRTRDWVSATVAGALVALTIGLVPFAVALEDVSPVRLALIGAPLAIVLVSSIGFFQWRVLRDHVARAGWWIATSAGAWIAGLVAFTAVSSPLWQEGQGPGLVAAIGLLGGLVMAATVAVTSGAALAWLIAAADAELDEP